MPNWWDVGAPIPQGIITVTSGYRIDNERYVILCDASNGTFKVTLPSAAQQNERMVHIKKIDTSASQIIIAAAGSETIDGSNTATLTLAFESVKLVSTGKEWFIL